MPGTGQAPLTLAEIAAHLGGDVLGDPQTLITGVATLASAQAGDISFLANPKYRAQLQSTAASAVILDARAAAAWTGAGIVARNPYADYARVVSLLHPAPAVVAGVATSARLASTVPASAQIGENVVIGARVVIGERVVIHAGAVIGDEVRIGDDAVIHPRVVIYRGCQLGARVIVHAGAVIGADGFGFAPDGGQWVKIPQIGRVLVGDDVEIGANTTIDRGALDDTRIGDGCKLDNQIQIGHNCRIGRHTVISGCTAIAGSVTIGEHCMIGGAAMITGHLSICDGAIISAGTFIAKNITRPVQHTSVYPVEPHERWLKNAAHLRHLDRLAERVSQLEKQLAQVATHSSSQG